METDCNPQYAGINLLGSSRAKMSCWVSHCYVHYVWYAPHYYHVQCEKAAH